MNYREELERAVNASGAAASKSIGTYMERSQHRALKFFFEPDSAYHEIPVHAYVADICRDGHIYEIQTSGFEALKSKLEVFLSEYAVTVVYPSVAAKTVIWTDPDTGETFRGRKIRRAASRFKLLPELLYIHEFVGREGFSVVVAETEAEVYKLLDGRGKDRKIKATLIDTKPVDILKITEIKTRRQLAEYFGFSPGECFTAADFSARACLKGRRLSAAIKVLQLLKITECTGKQGKRLLYRVNADFD